jgi:hypothetical protein
MFNQLACFGVWWISSRSNKARACRKQFHACRVMRAASVVITIAALVCLGQAARADDERLQRVIENVRANEALYQNVEAHVAEAYKMLDPDDFAGMDLIKSSNATARSVRQGHLVYYRMDATLERMDQTTVPEDCLMGYDGEYTRRIERQTANLIHGPYAHCQCFRPHAWLLYGARVCFPLSVWLTGGKELQAIDGAGMYKDYWHQKVSYEKDEVVDGLHAVKLRAEQVVAQEPKTLASFRYLWLAIDRNYLPIKTEGFIPRWSKTLPREVGRAMNFREISPGVWLPFHRSTVTYSEKNLAANKLIAINTNDVTLTKIDLNPHYDISLFRDIPFPNGTKVYEVKDGKILNSYTEGEKAATQSVSGAWRWWWWLIGLFVACVVARGWLLYRKRSMGG